MEVRNDQQPPAREVSRGRRLMVGGNVAITIVLLVAIVAFIQWLVQGTAVRADMTSSGVNSLSEGTERLLRNLDRNVRITSFYFETDREEEDQAKYRRAVSDLLDLYAGMNRSKIVAEWVNPLKDHSAYNAAFARLQELPKFKEQIEQYKSAVDRYQTDLAGRINELLQAELARAQSIGGALGAEASKSAVAPVEGLLTQLSSVLEISGKQVEAAVARENPDYSSATSEIKTVFQTVSKSLKDLGQYGQRVLSQETLPSDQAEYLGGLQQRCADLVTAIEAEQKTVNELKPLDYDTIADQLVPTGNAVLVETDEDAIVVDFTTMWPPLAENTGGMRIGFKDRGFKGEEKLTAAILRATHQEQTAVVFVRYGGTPLFFGGFLPNQPPAAYGEMKQQLEDANFIVQEWDLKTQEQMPEIDPKPTRTIFVVLKPAPPERDPMGRPNPQDQPFAPLHLDRLKQAMGDAPRAVFIAGWAPGMMGAFPSAYEYDTYLKENWGVSVDTNTLLIRAVSVAPGKYRFVQDPLSMSDVEVNPAHPIVSGASARRVYLPWCAPLNLDNKVEGVTVTPLITQPTMDGIWGAKDVQKYIEQQLNEYVTKVEGDSDGPFTLAAAADKGDQGKVVVISSRRFAEDDTAFARVMAIGPEGLLVRSRNPGNVSLLVNSLHWINDNTDFMNIGQPIDANVLEVKDESTVRTVQAFTIFIWPALALCTGGVVWWMRRR